MEEGLWENTGKRVNNKMLRKGAHQIIIKMDGKEEGRRNIWRQKKKEEKEERGNKEEEKSKEKIGEVKRRSNE